MTLRPEAALNALSLALLRGASLLVPRRQRAEWRREWRAELWHVRQACTPACGVCWTAEREVAMFCLGSIQDALYLRGHLAQKRIPPATTMGSASQCILLLAGLVAASYALALALPGVSVARRAAQYRTTKHLILVQGAGSRGGSVPDISPELYRFWKRRHQDLFDDFAFYQIKREFLSPAFHPDAVNRIAVASPNLFQLLGLPIQFADGAPRTRPDLPKLILSDASWKRDFAADPHIAGRVVQLRSGAAMVSGVAPDVAWRLPGNVDGWLLVEDGGFSTGGGFLLAHLKPTATQAAWDANWLMSAPTPDGSMADFSCISLIDRSRTPEDLFLFALFLACLALPATTSLPLGEYRVSSQKLSWSKKLHRWGFLTCKIALLLPIVYFVPLDLAHLGVSVDPASSVYIQLVASFSICLFGLRWALRDQRQRCPVCLRKLTHPARVGQPSRNFLAWNGTELLCVGGHGLLHIPEIQTSWFDTQRWIYLDPSWDVLFAEPRLVPANYC